jgi:hypothetical protein
MVWKIKVAKVLRRLMYIKAFDLVGWSRKMALRWCFSSVPIPFGLAPRVFDYGLKAKMRQLR